jgi:hypothetical protein
MTMSAIVTATPCLGKKASVHSPGNINITPTNTISAVRQPLRGGGGTGGGVRGGWPVSLMAMRA